MAQAIEIRLWCDRCLDGDERVEGATLVVPALFGEPAFELEACVEHAEPLRAAVALLRPYGRKPEGKVPTVRRRRPDDTPAANTCPICPHVSPSLSALRSHLRDQHDKGLADVGLADRNYKCSVCPEDSGWFDKGQGFSAHIRAFHPDADPDGRAVAAKVMAA